MCRLSCLVGLIILFVFLETAFCPLGRSQTRFWRPSVSMGLVYITRIILLETDFCIMRLGRFLINGAFYDRCRTPDADRCRTPQKGVVTHILLFLMKAQFPFS